MACITSELIQTRLCASSAAAALFPGRLVILQQRNLSLLNSRVKQPCAGHPRHQSWVLQYGQHACTCTSFLMGIMREVWSRSSSFIPPSSHPGHLRSFRHLWLRRSIEHYCTCLESALALATPRKFCTYLIRTCPSVPVCLRSMYSSVPES
jgi:hypothetical protein